MDFLRGSNVIVFDTETTGIPARVPNTFFMNANSYYPFDQNDKYNNSRLLSIAWFFTSDYNPSSIDTSQIKEYIRTPDTQITSINNSHIHGITFEDLMNNGVPFEKIITDYGFGDAIMKCDYIVAHNILFDINILMNEFWRCRELLPSMYLDKLKELVKNKKIVCTCKIGKSICKITYSTPNKSLPNKLPTNQPISYKAPKLIEFYKHIYGKEFENAHSATGDVKALLEIMMKL